MRHLMIFDGGTIRAACGTKPYYLTNTLSRVECKRCKRCSRTAKIQVRSLIKAFGAYTIGARLLSAHDTTVQRALVAVAMRGLQLEQALRSLGSNETPLEKRVLS